MDGLDAFIQINMPKLKERLAALVRIPSISQMPKEHGEDCIRVVEAVAGYTRELGFDAEVIETGGLPAMIATLEVESSLPWLTIYNHLDVQPANETLKDGNPAWKTNPFDPLITDEKIIGRGATDDKGPTLTTLYALQFLKESGKLPVNIQLIYETEEESGSKHFGAFMDANSAKLKVPDSVLVSDTIFEGEHPGITYGLRGLIVAEVELTTGKQEVHSGIAGGFAQNPFNVLSFALGSCTNPQTGEALIPGFYNGILTPTEAEMEAITQIAEKTSVSLELDKMHRTHAYTDNLVEAYVRMWQMPTFEVHGYEGSIKGTKIPPYAKAFVSMRLVQGQDPDDIAQKFTDYMHTVHPDIVVTIHDKISAVRVPVDNPYMQKAAEACRQGFGKEAVYVASGGSIGSIPHFQRLFPQAPIVMIAQSLLSDGYHAPNEEFQWKQAENGIRTMAQYIASLR